MRTLCEIAVFFSVLWVHPLWAQQLPAPPQAVALSQPIALQLELIVNQRFTGIIIPIELFNGHFKTDPMYLHEADIQLPQDSDGLINIDELPGVTVVYDEANQRLYVEVPSSWLPHQILSQTSNSQRLALQASPGLLVNYEYYLTSSPDTRRTARLWTEFRSFGNSGHLSSTGTYNFSKLNVEQDQPQYIRLDTSWRYSSEETMRSYEIGDLISLPLKWSNPVRMGGIQISRNFSIRPDILTYPLPNISGSAAIPSSVELFINGYKNSQIEVAPGPFTLTDLPWINGAGEATIVTEDALGRNVSSTIPFYVSQDLLKSGLSEFGINIGKLRENYGQKNFSYGAAATSGSLRYGLTDAVTVEAHGELADSLLVTGIGTSFAISNYGIINTSYSFSNSAFNDGRQFTAGYEYNHSVFSFSFNHTRRQSGYRDLSVYPAKDSTLAQQSNRIVASSRLGKWGSLGVGFFDLEDSSGSRTRLLNLSLSPALGKSNLFITANKEIGGKWSAAMQFTLTAVQGMSSTISMDRKNRNGRTEDSQRIHHSRTVPSSGGLGWKLDYQRNQHSDDYRQVEIDWLARYMQMKAGVYGRSGSRTSWAEMSGSLVWMQDFIHAAPKIRDSFVVVSTQGIPDIPVLYENQHVGKTNKQGFLLVPWTSAYYPARYQIDGLSLPENIATTEFEHRIAVSAGAGYILPFNVKTVLAASIRLLGPDGIDVQIGSVAETQNGLRSYVGWDGMVYFEGLEIDNRITVRFADGKSCQCVFSIDGQTNEIAQVGPLLCEPLP